MRRRDEVDAIAREFKTHVLILGSLAVFAWGLELVDLFVLGSRLNSFGIYPRRIFGLRGILFSPFLHSGLGHLISNTIPFLTLGWLVMLRETRDFFVVSFISLVVSGLGVWVFGSPGFHIGASGIVFGYFGFLLLRGYFERSPLAIALALTVGLLYGSLLWGVLPLQYGISWEGHLFGFLGGALAAKVLSQPER